MRVASIDDLRCAARRRLPRIVFDFIDGGAGDERSLEDNRRAFEAWDLLPRVNIDVSERTLGTRILGQPASLPLILAPTGLAGLFHPGGEVAACRAAIAAGIPFCLSTNSVASMETVAEAVPRGERWFQLYPLRDRGLMTEMLSRASQSGYETLCLTVDLPVQGRRDRDLRNGFTVPLRPGIGTLLDLAMRPAWVLGLLKSPVSFGNFEKMSRSATSIAQHIAELFDPSADWSLVAELRRAWQGRFVLKGILHAEDARHGAAVGADAIIVSNHGGRQLDSVPGTCAVLPDICDAVRGEIDVVLDGGVRRGTDVLKALALGASACMIGRPFLWGLAAYGEVGVEQAIEIFRSELDTAMALLGVRRLDELHSAHVRHRDR